VSAKEAYSSVACLMKSSKPPLRLKPGFFVEQPAAGDNQEFGLVDTNIVKVGEGRVEQPRTRSSSGKMSIGKNS